jgi:RimJ/RimL family protein N-acetyltransferase
VAIALRTPRLLLREWRDDDREPFAAMCADPDLMRYYYRPPADRVATDAWIDRMRRHNGEHGFAYWAVELPGDAGLIGAIGLTRVRSPDFRFAPAVEIGWRLARSHWGRGYATEAAHAVLDDGFGRLGLAEIVSFTVPANSRSWRVMERLGMTREPTDDFDHPSVPEGHELRRCVLYRLHRGRRP